MKRMIAMTMSPGATTAAARLIWPSPTRIPPPAATSTKKNVPSSSEKSRRHSRFGSSHSSREPNSSSSRCRTRCSDSSVESVRSAEGLPAGSTMRERYRDEEPPLANRRT